MSDELDLFRVGHGGGLVYVFVLGAIYDGVVHEWGIRVFLVFCYAETDYGVLDVVEHGRCDGFCAFVMADVDSEVFGALKVGGDVVVFPEGCKEVLYVFHSFCLDSEFGPDIAVL